MPDDSASFPERLRQLSRVENAEAGMPDEKLTEQQEREILDWLKRYQAEHGLSDRVVANRIGVGASTLAEVKKGHYRGNRHKVLHKISRLKTRPLPQQREIADTFVEISFVKDMYGVIRAVVDSCADGHPVIGMIIAPAGSGKSIGLRGIAWRHSDSIYMEIAETHTHFRAFLQELGRLVKVTRYKYMNTSDLFAAICEKLTGSYRLLIFDEVHLAARRVQNAIRQIQDRTGVPIVLAGLPDLEKQVLHGRFDDSRGATISSRIGPKYDYRNVSRTTSDPTTGRKRPARRKLLHTAQDVRALLDREKLRLHPEALWIAIAMANDADNGMLRLMDRVLYQVRRAYPEVHVLRAEQILETMSEWIGGIHVEQMLESWKAEQLDRKAQAAAARAAG